MNLPRQLGSGNSLSPRRESIDVQSLKDSIRLSDVVGQHTKLRPSGRSLSGRCPFHDDRKPSLVVTDDIGLYYCHGCHATGDVIDFVRAIHRCGFLDAVKHICGTIPALSVARNRERAKKLDRAHLVMTVNYARFQWQETVPIDGTPAERYLRRRGIKGPIPPTLRYGRVPLWIDPGTGKKGPMNHALVGGCQDVSGRVTGIHKTLLRVDGQPAQVRSPKQSLGQIRGGAVRLGPEASEVIVCEGVEDGLTIHELLPSTPVWVALGTGNMPNMILPPGIKRVLVAGDNDKPGRAAVEQTCEAFRTQGKHAAAIFPGHAFGDFNDQLRARPLDE
ncbi:MAG: primase [Sphingomonadales bacterium]|nr:primase [Sphingomonadales bacterium]